MAAKNRYDRRIPGYSPGAGGAAIPPRHSELLRQAAQFLLDEKASRAERILRRVLKSEPENAEALHLAGVARHRAGKHRQARELVEKAIRIAPDVPDYHVTLGGLLDEADEVPAVVAAYERAVELDPLDAQTYFALANAWKRLGHLDAAIECYERTLTVAPSDVPTLYNLGNSLKAAGRFEEAVSAYRRAVAAQPGFVPVYRNLGTTLKDLGRTQEGFEAMRAGAQIMFAPDALSEEELLQPLRTSHAKLQHDAEQIEYLVALGKLPESYGPIAAVYRELIENGPEERPATEAFRFPSGAQAEVAKAYNRLIYLDDAPRCEGGAINPALDTGEIERAYHARRPEIAYFDDFLTDEALRRLRRFCLDSTIWYKRYENGYLGAMLGDGFASPLLAQIVDELPQALPGIFGDHKLNQAWAFKYDGRLTGINLHADFAAVNVNFWITPDDALENADAGGLVVWDKEAPLDWDFEKYNADESAMRRFLRENEAEAVRVPYRQNRALVFNSDLFHETDRIAFRPGYENRRINITLLYGDRRNA